MRVVMRFATALAEVRSVTTPVIARRGVVVAVSGAAQRILAPALAQSLFQRGVVAKLVIGLALSAVFTAHTLVQRAFAARTEAELLQRTAAAVLGGNVLRAGTRSEDEVRGEIRHAIYETAQVVTQTIPNLMGDLASCAVLGIWVLLAEPGRLVVVAAALTLVAGAALFVSRASVDKAVARAWAVQNRAYEAFVDIWDGRLEVVASGRRDAFLSDLRDRTSAWGQAGAAVAASSSLAGRLPLLAIAVLVAVAIGVSPWARHSVGVTLADLALFASVTPAFAALAHGLHGHAKAERWIGVVVRLFQSAPPVEVGKRATGDLARRGIAFEDVSFRYDAKAAGYALREVSFFCRGASTLALAGPNGSGKSTCLRLLLALAKPVAGRIVVGGEPLESVDPDAWRRRVAFLPQRPYLPPRSEVQAAIRWLAPGSSDERIVSSLERVGMLASLRKGGRNPLAVTVDTLSIGERQRIALARLLCHDAALFLLDEPDANLDRAGIALVADVLRDLAKRHMVVVAAHTQELLAVADCVVTLEGGRIAHESSAGEESEHFASRLAQGAPRS